MNGTASRPVATGAGRDAPWITGEIPTPAGPVPQVGTALSRADRWGAVRVRINIGRMRYALSPGLYAVGAPTAESLVFVSANYKLSFDRLRERLRGMDAWILVLDTNGINVWCAAGKGTFGTDEVILRIAATGLARVVSHRRLILPQLGASGVAAHEVKRRSGFRVVYGPVRARDIPAFIDAGLEATPEMRRVHFNLADRMTIAPVEFVQWGVYVLFIIAVLFLLGGIHRGGYDVALTMARGARAALLTLVSFVGAVALVPLLLPWIPGRAFSVKGGLLGLLIAVSAVITGGIPMGGTGAWMEAAAWFLLIPAICAFVAMNFTGTTTFTSQSGVQVEMKFAMPAQIVASAAGLGLWIASAFVV